MPSNEALPAGTTAFLFTDVEGSTRLWQQYPEGMPAALALHHATLEAAVAEQGGHVFQIVGDAFHTAFPTVQAALAAAASGQRALAAAPWEDTGPMLVRMAVHAGQADLQTGDVRSGQYRSSLTLSHTARLLGAANGGQVLVSETAGALAREGLPPQLALIDLGIYRLRDLARPEHVYQLAAPGLPDAQLPLRAPGGVPTNLPLQLTSFIGREAELAALQGLLRSARLITLTGSGGTGKSRLALEVAGREMAQYAEGVWLVELASLFDAELLAQTAASAMGLLPQPGRTILQTLQNHLAERQVLLLLDNCEHLVEAAAILVHPLLQSAPRLVVVATSREPLGVPGEVIYRVPSLSLPPASTGISLADVAASEAVRLFVERARSVQPAFELTEENAAGVLQICRRLDGIALAIELAAARTGLLSPTQIAERLDDHFKLLKGGSRTHLPRQQTLQALVDWSYNLLSEPERVLLRRLAVFGGSFDLEAVEVVCSEPDEGALDLLDLLGQLIDKSLVSADAQGAEARYRLLEMIRQYGSSKLREAGEWEGLRARHATYYGAIARGERVELRGAQGLLLLESELDNLRFALEWLLEHRPLEALRTVVPLNFFWYRRGLSLEGSRRLREGLRRVREDALSGEGAGDREVQGAVAHALAELAGLTHGMGHFTEAQRYMEEGKSLALASGDRAALSSVLMHSATVPALGGEVAQPRESLEEVVKTARALGFPSALGAALLGLARLAADQDHDYARAEAYLAEASALVRAERDEWGIVILTLTQALINRLRGRIAEARDSYRESMNRFRGFGDVPLANIARSGLAETERMAGNLEQASALYVETLLEWDRLGNEGAVARCLECLAFIAMAQADLEQAARLFGAAEALREASGSPMTARERVEYDEVMGQLHPSLPEVRLKAAWSAGRGLTPRRALQLLAPPIA